MAQIPVGKRKEKRPGERAGVRRERDGDDGSTLEDAGSE
jgi:hypothetical protein